MWGAGLGVAAAVAPTFAQTTAPQPLRVVFSAPSECGANDRLLELSRGLLGADAEHADVIVTAKVTAGGERRYKLRLELRGAVTGDRTISGANCDEAVRAGAVVIALAINPDALATPATETSPAVEAEPVAEPASRASNSGAEPARAPDAKPAEPKAPVEPAPPALPADLPERSSPSPEPDAAALVFGVFGRAAYGLAPSARLGVKASVGAVWHDVQLRVHGYFDPSTPHEDTLAGGVRFTSLGGGADVCARVGRWSRLSGAICGGWSLTEVNASAPNVSNPTAQDAFVSAGALGVSLGVGLTDRVSLLLEGGYSIPTSRPRFVVDVSGAESAPVFRVAPGPLAAVGFQFGL